MSRWISWLRDRSIRWGTVLLFSILAFVVGRTCAPTGAASADAEHGDHEHEHAEEAAVEYVCPMHPQIRMDAFGTCPICHMDLVPVSVGEGDDIGNAVSVSERTAALARVRTEKVGRPEVTRTLRLFGRVAAPESGDGRITARTAGRIERVFVSSTGESIRRGQRLFTLYSPDLVLAQETLIHAREVAEEARASGGAARLAAAEAAARAAMTELRVLGIPAEEIEGLIADGRASEQVVIRSPAAGTVIERNVRVGEHVERGSPLYTLSNLGEVWIQLEIYEQDLPHVAVDDRVVLRIPGLSRESLEGRIAFIDPVLDADQRIARARVILDNSEGQLRPGMLVDAVLEQPVLDARGRSPVTVPASAVLWTGPKSYIYVWDPIESPPVAMPVEVTLGERLGDRIVIESGVFPGEEVVINGAFRLDANLQIRGGDTMMSGHGHVEAGHER